MFSLHSTIMIRQVVVVVMAILGLLAIAIKGHPAVSIILVFLAALGLLVAGYVIFDRLTEHT